MTKGLLKLKNRTHSCIRHMKFEERVYLLNLSSRILIGG